MGVRASGPYKLTVQVGMPADLQNVIIFEPALPCMLAIQAWNGLGSVDIKSHTCKELFLFKKNLNRVN